MFFIYTKDFFNHLRSELHSERTIETYCQSLNAFRIYLYETYSKTVDQITIDFVTEEVIREFLSSVANSNSVGTRNVRLSGIKAYLKYAATRDMELVPLQISISAVKHKKTYPKRHNWLDKADIELILAQPPQRGYSGMAAAFSVALAAFRSKTARTAARSKSSPSFRAVMGFVLSGVR